ncbi:MAG: efflux RND transporter periplasmic adaptor subunit [Crocinitomix sp.]|nr:efflux RND transporter periplasmic adaptor subunit [Crocinitomix sp.]
MKKKFIYFIALGSFLAACGPAETNPELDALNSKRDSLKVELALVDAQILELDTAKVEMIPIVTADKVSVQDFVHQVDIPGTVETDQNALINAEASGVIQRIHVREGQTVSKGQTLMTIDSEILASTMGELEAALELADYMFDKQQTLKDKGVGVEIEYEQAKNQKLSLEKKIKTLQSQKGKTIVRAPFSGVIDDIMVNQGEMAAPQIPLLRIVNNSNVTIVATLSENLLSKVNIGTAVEMRFPSLNDTVIISTVSNKGNYIDPTNRTFRIQIAVKNNKLLLPNQFAEVKVTDFTRKNAIVIDSEALLQDTDNNMYVYRLTSAGDGQKQNVEKIFIKVIKMFEGEACVEGALKDGDLLVVKGAKGITDADKVIIQ